jgi:transposase-like protein
MSDFPICRHCGSRELRSRGWIRPDVEGRSRTAIGINCNEDAVRQRVRCHDCRKSFLLPVGVSIPAFPGQPKKSRDKCDCGSADLRPAGWMEDGRQSVRCNVCNKEFALLSGMFVAGKQTDKLGRPMQYQTEFEPDFPDAAEEASALLKLIHNGKSSIGEIRRLIGYSAEEKKCLEFLAANGMVAQSHVERILSFRDRVLATFSALIDRELAAMPEPKKDSAEEPCENSLQS